MKRLISIIFVAFLVVGNATARVTYTQQDSITIERLLREAPGPDVLWLARQFINRPYVGQTLEVNAREQLVVNTRQLDCTTLVETVAALAICVKEKKHDFCSFCQVLRVLRYREGKLDGYVSRLHYFTDWIEDNTRLGLVSEVQLQSSPFTAVQIINVGYMSQHPTAYTALKAHPELVKTIALQEQQLNGRRYRFIPKAKVQDTKELREAVHDGDIIAITCTKPGLDIAHLGFAVWRKDGLHLLNASQLHKKVVEEPMTLGQYLQKHPTHTGIRVVRLKNI